jgi:hypothetical protein
MTLYENLEFDFDTRKFGDALDPRGTLEDEVVFTTPPITKWQYDAVTANNLARTTYFKNPVANVCNTIYVYANSIYYSTNTYQISALSAANTAACTLCAVANNFFAHTQRLSGLTNSANSALPDFFSAISYGRTVFPILAKFENVSNNVPILGSMTSLFIESDLQGHEEELRSINSTIVSSVTYGGLPPGYSTSLSSGDINTIIQTMNDASNTMNTRITHDVKFFGKVVQLSNNYMEVMKYSGFGDVEAYLVENFVGTRTLIEKL